MRVLRGAGLEGIGAIAPSRVMPSGLCLVRPLLGSSRVEVEAYLVARGLPRCEDPTNTSMRFVRNRLRRNVMGALRETAGEAGLAPAYRSVLTLREDAHALGQLAEVVVNQGVETEERAWYFSVVALREMGRSAASQVLRHGARRVVPGHVLGQAAVGEAWLRISGRPGDRAGLWRDGTVALGRDGGWAVVRHVEASQPEIPMPSTLAVGQWRLWRDARLVVFETVMAPVFEPHQRWRAFPLPCDVLSVVPAADVKWISPAGVGGRKRVSTVLAELGVPGPWRAGHPVVVDAEGPLWIVGGPVADRLKMPLVGTRCIRVEVERMPWYVRTVRGARAADEE